MNNIRRYTAISGIVNIVYYVDDRVVFDVATFNNKIIAIAITQRAYRYNNQFSLGNSFWIHPLVELSIYLFVILFCCMVSGIFWYPILVSRRIM